MRQPRTPTYRSWAMMKQRCLNPNTPGYHLYGGRGIKVCERWLSFSNFLADMGPRPAWATGGIDRKDSDGHYEPGNCRWATSKVQGRNNGEQWRKRDSCSHGHLYTAENTYIRLDGARVCRQCRRDRQRRYLLRKARLA